MKKLMSFMLSIAICFGATTLSSANEPSSNAPGLKDLIGAEDRFFKTDKLKLSIPTDEELKELSKFYKNVEIGYFLRNNDKSLTEQEAFERLKDLNSGGNLSFVIKNTDEQLVGELILSPLNSKIFNVAYWVIPEFRGFGYAPKACELLIRELHRKDKDLVFLIGLDKENHSSKRVVEKLEIALTSQSEVQDCDDLNNMHYEVVKFKPFTIKYKISPINKDEFKFDIFLNSVQMGSKVFTREQIENITYKRIFDLKEIELTRLNYYVRLVY